MASKLASSVSSVEIRLGVHTPACVLDATLALKPFGLLLATRLAHEWPVWLLRNTWEMIDSDRCYRDRPSLLADGGEVDEDLEGVVRALADWNAAWTGNRINGGFHWVGDRRRESALPEDSDQWLPIRFEALHSLFSEGLDPARAWSWREVCASEALALAAALGARPAVILTVLKDGETVPALVATWKERWPNRCTTLKPKDAPVSLPPSVKIGMPALLDGRYRLAAVHVSAPRAFALPWGVGGEAMWGEGDPQLDPPAGPPPDPWEDAEIAWHELR